MLEEWSTDQWHWPNLGAYQECRISGRTSDLLNLNLNFDKITRWCVGVLHFEKGMIWSLVTFLTSVSYHFPFCKLLLSHIGLLSVSYIVSSTLQPQGPCTSQFLLLEHPFLTVYMASPSSLCRSLFNMPPQRGLL